MGCGCSSSSTVAPTPSSIEAANKRVTVASNKNNKEAAPLPIPSAVPLVAMPPSRNIPAYDDTSVTSNDTPSHQSAPSHSIPTTAATVAASSASSPITAPAGVIITVAPASSSSVAPSASSSLPSSSLPAPASPIDELGFPPASDAGIHTLHMQLPSDEVRRSQWATWQLWFDYDAHRSNDSITVHEWVLHINSISDTLKPIAPSGAAAASATAPSSSSSHHHHSNSREDMIMRVCDIGIPAALRLRVWSLAMGVRQLHDYCLQHAYDLRHALTRVLPEHDRQVALDVTRTYTDHILFKNAATLASLSRILRGISVAIPAMGYVQGLNFVAGNIMLHALAAVAANDELHHQQSSAASLRPADDSLRRIFPPSTLHQFGASLNCIPSWIAIPPLDTTTASSSSQPSRLDVALQACEQWCYTICVAYLLRTHAVGYYLPLLPRLTSAHSRLTLRIDTLLPTLAAHLREEMIDSLLFASPWLLTIWLYNLPPSIATLIMDTLITIEPGAIPTPWPSLPVLLSSSSSSSTTAPSLERPVTPLHIDSYMIRMSLTILRHFTSLLLTCDFSAATSLLSHPPLTRTLLSSLCRQAIVWDTTREPSSDDEQRNARTSSTGGNSGGNVRVSSAQLRGKRT